MPQNGLASNVSHANSRPSPNSDRSILPETRGDFKSEGSIGVAWPLWSNIARIQFEGRILLKGTRSN